MRRNLFRFFLILFAAVAAVGQQQGSAGSDVPSVERLREHVTFLASEKMDGRRTGTAGAQEASNYVVRMFARYKLKPAFTADGPDKLYRQLFPFVAGVDLGKDNAMRFTPGSGAPTKSGAALDLRLGEDWMPLGFSVNRKLVDAPATFVGYGITAKDLNYDDYAGARLTGRIAIAFSGTPDGDDPHGKFARYAGVRWKAIAAREQGAAALLVIAREANFKDEPLARLRYNNSAGDAGIPVAVVSRRAAARILEAGGLAPVGELDELERRARAASASVRTSGAQAAPPIRAPAQLERVTLTMTTDIVKKNAPASNIVGILEGTDPKLRNEAIVIGAHYDHLGRGGDEGSRAQSEGEVHHGADDNASGVAGMLELARLFSTNRPRRTIVFIAFGGEEEGLLGSNFYVNHPVVPLAQTVAMINMDMIGRLKDNKLIVGGVGTAGEWRQWIAKANLETWSGAMLSQTSAAGSFSRSDNLNLIKPFALTLNEDGYGPSDHASFYAKQIPVLFFWTGTHEDYHKPSDTADKIDYEGEARIIAFVFNLLRTLDASASRPTFTVAKSEATGRTTGFRVYLGTIPNYTDSNEGLKLDGVREDSPAARAGLRAGDVIVKLAGRDVRNIEDYSYVLGEMKAGEEYEVEVLRGKERLRFKLTPAARRQ